MEAMTKHRSHSAAFKRQVAEEFIAGETLHAVEAARHLAAALSEQTLGPRAAVLVLAERGIDISHETVRFWWNRFGPIFAAEIRKRQIVQMRAYPQLRWHLDEVIVKVNGKLCYLWRAVDHGGEVLETMVTAKRDKAAALKFLKRIMKQYGQPRSVVTDGLRAYSAAMNEIGVAAERHEVGGRLNNRAENSHQPFRRHERAMQRFRSLKTLQKFQLSS